LRFLDHHCMGYMPLSPCQTKIALYGLRARIGGTLQLFES
jgi:hypothetical protein